MSEQICGGEFSHDFQTEAATQRANASAPLLSSGEADLPIPGYDSLHYGIRPNPSMNFGAGSIHNMVAPSIIYDGTTWTCENHLSPVPDIPKGESCPVCNRNGN